MEITQPRNAGGLCRHHTTFCPGSPRGHASSSRSHHPRPSKQGPRWEGPTDHPFRPRRLCPGQPLPTCPLLAAQDIDSRPITDKALPTPVQVENVNRWLQGYGKERHSLIEGFTFGFDLGFEGIAKNVVCNNLKSAFQVSKKSISVVFLSRHLPPKTVHRYSVNTVITRVCNNTHPLIHPTIHLPTHTHASE